MYKNRKFQYHVTLVEGLTNQSSASDFVSSDSLEESANGRWGIKLGNCIDFIAPNIFGC